MCIQEVPIYISVFDKVTELACLHDFSFLMQPFTQVFLN